LYKIRNIIDFEKEIKNKELNEEILKKAKQLGFSDKKIAKLKGKEENEIRKLRKSFGVLPVIKQIDTLAAEWPAATNYLYLTHNGDFDDISFEKKRKVIVLGSGCYRIGSSVEFDWCCVNMAWALKERGFDESIMVNCNPETVSTDFDVMDKLYFEELTLERVLDIYEKEEPEGIVVSVGGQIPNNLALKLAKNGVKIIGTSAEDIDRAEDRSKFSKLLDELEIKQPNWEKVENIEKAKEFAEKTGYPVLIRPSYVLSGSAMNVATNESQLKEYLTKAAKVSKEYPVVISKFITNAREVEVDCVSDGENVLIGAIIEHLENAGVHSGDAIMSIPTLTLSEAIKNKIREYTRRIARSLRIKGPFNIQYLVKDGEVYVIECNLRASRSMPFVSKTVGTNLMQLAADAILGKRIKDGEYVPKIFGVKVPQFSFMRLEGVDPVTGVEMASTGEIAGFGKTFTEAFVKALISSGVNLPEPGDGVLISIGEDKSKIIDIANRLVCKNMKIYATEKTSEELKKHGIESIVVRKVSEPRPNILDYLMNESIKMVINIPFSNGIINNQALDDEYQIRRKAVEFKVHVVGNLQVAKTITDALDFYHKNRIEKYVEFAE
jgi:carbamoyl-phosphate synthase large subunit